MDYIEFSGFKQKGYFIKTTAEVLEHLSDKDWHLIEGTKSDYIVFLSSDMAKFTNNVDGLKELVLKNGKYYKEKDKLFVNISDIPEDIDDYYDNNEILYTGSKKFDDIMIDRGYFEYGGTRRSHRHLTKKFNNTTITELINDLTGADIRDTNIETFYDYLDASNQTSWYNPKNESIKSTTETDLKEIYLKLRGLGVRNESILCEAPKEAPSKMIENNTAPYKPFSPKELFNRCREYSINEKFKLRYTQYNDIVLYKDDEVITTIEESKIEELKKFLSKV